MKNINKFYSSDELAHRIMGTEFERVCRYFYEIFRMCVDYETNGIEYYFVTFATKRSHVLELIFQDILTDPSITVFQDTNEESFRKNHINEFK